MNLPMHIHNTKQLFRLVFAAELISISASSYVFQVAQEGPNWDTPMVVICQMVIGTLLAGILAAAAAGGALLRHGFTMLPQEQKVLFWSGLAVAGGFVAAIWLADPMQWPVYSAHLSSFARLQFLPTLAVCTLAYWRLAANRS